MKAIETPDMSQVSGLTYFTGQDWTVEHWVPVSFRSRVVLVHDIHLSLPRDFCRQETHDVFGASQSAGQNEMSHQQTPQGQPFVIEF